MSSPLERYAYQFKRAHKFILNHSIEIRVFQGAKEMGHQWIPFRQACEILDISSNSMKVVYLSSHDVNDKHMSEEEIVDFPPLLTVITDADISTVHLFS